MIVYIFGGLFIIALFILGLMLFKYRSVKEFSDNQILTIEFPNGKISAEIASSMLKKQKGLSGRDALEDGAGMLFVFNTPDILKFWMIDMKFPLDFVWINKDTVIDISENIPAPTQNKPEIARISPKKNADKVLEINAGMANKLGILIGQEIDFLNN